MLSAQTIRERVGNGGPGSYVKGTRLVIAPFVPEKRVAFGRSYGLASASYDVRLAQDLWVWPLWGRLGSLLEYIEMPHDLSAEVKDKSTNARHFILVQNTFIDPGWCGYLTVEITRLLPWPVKLRAGTPIAQIVFHQLDRPTERPYNGKYLGQGGHSAPPTPAILERD